MKILVGVKRVIDYNVRVQINREGTGVITEGVKMSINPFDEIAVEEALRIRDRGEATEVVVAGIGPGAAQQQLRTALAMGADRALLFETDDYTRQAGIKHFITSRGCPYDCSYCFNHALAQLYRGKGRRLRQMSVERVIEEVKGVQAHYPLQFVVFLDDLFIVYTDWLRELAEEFPRQVGLPFFCNVRANLVTPEKVDLLKEAGCASVGMGLETGNAALRNQILNRNLSDEQIIEASRLLREAGIRLLTTNMLGLPGGSLAHDFETLALNHACRPAYANAFLYQPYPRTELGEYAREGGFVEGSVDDIDPSAWERSVLRFSSAAEKRQIENFNKLFALAVEWPWLTGLMRGLIKLPPNGALRLVYKLWKGYAIKNRIHPYRPSPGEFVQTVRRFMRFD